MRTPLDSIRGRSCLSGVAALWHGRPDKSPYRFVILLIAVLALAAFAYRLLTASSRAASAVSHSIVLCEQNQENLAVFTELAYKTLGLNPILVEPKLLELVLDLEKTREEQVVNRTRLYGRPETKVLENGKVLTWQHRSSNSEPQEEDGIRAKSSSIDYGLPLTVFGNPRTICNQWRTSFIIFYKDGLAKADGTQLQRTSWQLADLSERMQKAGFTMAAFEGEDQRLASAGVGIKLRAADPLLLHLRFFRGKHNIYLTILYERSEANHFWHAALNPTNGSKSPVHFGFHAGSWMRFSSRQVHLDFGTTLLVPNNTQMFLDDFPSSRFISCNMARAEQFFLSFPPQEVASDEETFVNSAIDVLRRGRSALNELNVPFWISSGTCLGWFRQCSVIPHSKDVDFGIFIKDFDEHIVMHMLMKGFKLKHQFGKVSDSLELSFVLNDVKLDFFFFYEEEGYMWNGGTQARTGKKFKYIFPKFSLCWTEFVGLRVRVPCQTQSYIEANYGLTWDTPVKEWDWKRSPPNVRENGQWNESEWSKVIQVY